MTVELSLQSQDARRLLLRRSIAMAATAEGDPETVSRPRGALLYRHDFGKTLE